MMTFDEIVKDKEYRERVIKYFKLPIRLSVTYEKFMTDMEFIKVADNDLYNDVIKLTEHDFNKMRKEQGTDTPDFSMEDVLEPIVEGMRNDPKWQAFEEKDFSKVIDGYEGATHTHAFYKKENDGKHFVSVDLEAANWQTLQTVLEFDESYEDFIVKYTDNKIAPKSKTVRTKIAGMLNAKAIMDYNKHLLKTNLNPITEVIHRETGVDLRGLVPVAFYADEVIFEVSESDVIVLRNGDLSELEETVKAETGIGTHITGFRLDWLDIQKGCIKVFDEGQYEIRNLSKDIVMLIEKAIRDYPYEEHDFEKVKTKLSHDEYMEMLYNTMEKYI